MRKVWISVSSVTGEICEHCLPMSKRNSCCVKCESSPKNPTIPIKKTHNLDKIRSPGELTGIFKFHELSPSKSFVDFFTWCWILPKWEAFHLCQLIEYLQMSKIKIIIKIMMCLSCSHHLWCGSIQFLCSKHLWFHTLN